VVVASVEPGDNYRVQEDDGTPVQRLYHRTQLKLAGDEVVGNFYYVEDIVAHRQGRNGRELLIKWQGFPSAENTWEPSANLPTSLLNAYLTSHGLAPEQAVLVPGASAGPLGEATVNAQLAARPAVEPQAPGVRPRRAATTLPLSSDQEEVILRSAEDRHRETRWLPRNERERGWSQRVTNKRTVNGETSYYVVADNYPPRWVRVSPSSSSNLMSAIRAYEDAEAEASDE